jgi:NADPH:quinone reductase-like Zn-dependent oxidoreductase
VAGVVESVGEGVTAFAAGDAVFGETVSGYSWRHGGAYAEYASVAESSLLAKPDHLTFEQAAVIPTSGMIALRSLSAHGGIEPGDKVLVNGAGGNVGSLAVQSASALGAEVTGVDCGRKMGLMRSLGADHVVDYDKEDATQGSRKYDFILDVASTLSLSRCKRVLSSDGSYVMIGHDHFGVAAGRWLGSLPRFAVMAVRSRLVRHVSSPDFSIASGVLMSSVARIVETKTIAPIVDKVFLLDEAAQAIEYMQGGQPCGAVVVSVD